jgi:hypothetical protein
MNIWQQILLYSYLLSSLVFFIKSLHETKNKKRVYGSTPYLFFLGAFVWGDMLVLGPFWITAAFFSLILKDWYLFLLIISLFWSVRSLGEIIYWLNEQFAGKNRNPPHTLKFHKLINNDAIWFVYQLFWQCVLVISIISSIYIAKLWLGN